MGQDHSRASNKDEYKDHHLDSLKKRYAELEDVGPGLSAATFNKLLYFPGAESIGKKWLALHPNLQDKPALTLEDFEEIINDSMGRTSYQFLFALFSKESRLDRKDAFELFNTARVLGLAAGYPDRDMVSADIEHTEVAHALADGLFSSLPSSKCHIELIPNVSVCFSQEIATADEFENWVQRNTPRLFNGVSRWIEIQVSTPSDHASHSAHIDLTDIVISLEGENISTCMMTPSIAWLLSCSVSPIYDTFGSWRLLYASHLHGQSGNRFQHHTYRYSGPSITLVRTQDGAIYAVAVDEEWKERLSAWGGDKCALLRVMPATCFCMEGIKVYDDLRTRHQAHGFGFGRDPKSPETAELWLDTTLSEGSTVLSVDGSGSRQTLVIDRVE
eukprot:gene8486-10246_t